MLVKTLLCGEVDVPEDKIYFFPDGLVGLSDFKYYFLMGCPDSYKSDFQIMQSVEVPELAFVVTNPLIFKPDYRNFEIPEEELKSIELQKIDDAVILTIVTLAPEIKDITTNLLAPLIFNPQKRIAKQVILSNSEYTTKYNLFQ